uniref:Ras-GEF domain-containing protein n=1 Tax=Arcella intermedia TaxID=1963864 RepID=A0A6B2L3S3_9EUKA
MELSVKQENYENAEKIHFVEIAPTLLAQQLTLVEQTFFQNVQMEEFYEKAWEDDTSGKVPNLSALLERFGEVCYWVASEVVSAHHNGMPSIKRRAETISIFIHTMKALLDLQNFNSVMQIYAGLNLPVVGKLKNSWALVPKEDRDIMNEVGQLMSYQQNYRNYRNALDSIIDSPCIPFISLLIRDLTFVEDNPTFVGDGTIINFQKMTILSAIFAQLQDYRSHLYVFNENPAIQLYLNSVIIKNPDELEIIVSKFMDPSGLDADLPSEGAQRTFEGHLDVSNALGDELLSALEVFEIGESGGGSNMKQHLLAPSVFNQFHDWMSKQNPSELLYLECWQAMYLDFKKVDFGDTQYAAETLRETAYDLYHLYLHPQAPKYIGAVNNAILEEIIQKLESPDENIKNELFDEIIEGCEAKLENTWLEFCVEVVL